MGLMHSNAQAARQRARIMRERRAMAEKDGVDWRDRKAYADWDRKRFNDLMDRLSSAAAEAKSR